MSREKSKELNTIIQELEAKIRILEEENTSLTDEAEGTLLLSLVSETLDRHDDIPTLLENGLERIAVLKNLPFCSCCSWEEKKITPVSSYLKYSDEINTVINIQINNRIMKELAGGSVVFDLRDNKKIKLELRDSNNEFRQSFILLIPFKTRFIPSGIFIFADDYESDRLTNLSFVLHHMVSMITERIDKLMLQSELREMNHQLEERVEKRTWELSEVNERLKIEIDKKVKTEEALAESEQHYKMVTELATDYVYKLKVDADGKIFMDFLSDSYYTITGRPKEDAATIESWSKIIHPEDLSKVMILLQKLTASCQSAELECRTYLMNHKDRWVNIFARSEWDEHENRVTAIVGAVKDITARKLAEEKLIESEERFRHSFEYSATGVCIIGTDRKFQKINNAFTEIFGYTEEEVKNYEINDITYPADISLGSSYIKGMLDGEIDSSSFEKRYVTKDKRIIWGHINSSLVRDKQNRPQFFITQIIDITERKRTEEALHESEQLFRIAFDNAPTGMSIISAHGFTYLAVNPLLCEMFGYTKEEFLGKTIKLVTHPDDEERSNEWIRKKYNGEPCEPDLEKRYIHKDGHIVWGLVRSQWINNEDGSRRMAISHIQDITKRKLAEEALIRYQLLSQNTQDIILFLRAIDGKILEANNAALKAYGYDREELMTKFIRDLRMNETVNNLAEQFKEANLKGLSFETFHRRRDGTAFPVEVSSTGMTMGDERILMSIIRDTTERKRTEEALKKSEEKFSMAFKTSPEPISISSMEDGRHIEVNDAFLKKTGFRRDEVIGHTSIELEFWVDINQRERFVEELSKNGSLRNFDSRFRMKNKRIRDFLISSDIIELEGKRCSLNYILDITERKRAEDEINMLANALKSIDECVTITDLDDNLIFANQSFLNTYGYNQEEIIGKQMGMLRSHENETEMINEILPSTLRGGWSGELINRRKDGSEFPIYLSTSVINDKDGKPLGLIGVAQDITERKKFEQELIRSKETAEQSDKMKSEFLAQMSHEIRTPINIIVSNISFINDQMEGKINSDDQECFYSINLATQRIIRTIELILNMSELQTGAYKSTPRNVDLDSQVLQYLFNEFHRTAKSKGIDLIYRSEVNETEIHADEYSVLQIFANLIDNAIKYTKEGKIEIVLVKNCNAEMFVEIKDTGIGINKDFMPHLFEPFVQEEQGYTRSYEGNGLGLSLVKKYCEINNARIEVESEKNVGSTFRVIFGKKN